MVCKGKTYPCAGVVSWECECNPATTRQEGDITTRRVAEVQVGGVGRLIEDTLTLTKNEPIVTVNMHRVRDGNGTARGLLNDPVCPDALGRELNQVVHTGVGGVFVDNILKSGIAPVNVDGGHIDAPDDDVLSVGSDLFNVDVDFEVIQLALEVRTGDGGVPPGGERSFILADSGCRAQGAGVGCSLGSTIVVKHGTTVEGVGASAVLSDLSAEPVVACSLVGCDDDIVSLTNG